MFSSVIQGMSDAVFSIPITSCRRILVRETQIDRYMDRERQTEKDERVDVLCRDTGYYLSLPRHVGTQK